VLLRALREKLGPKTPPLLDRAMLSLHHRVSMAMTNLATVEDFIDYYQALDPSSFFSAILNEEEFRRLAYTNLKETLRSMQQDVYTKFVMDVFESECPLNFKTDVADIHKLLIKTNQVRVTSHHGEWIAHEIAKFQVSSTSKFNLPIPYQPPMDFIPYGYPPPPSFLDPSIYAIRP
jgi:hypothetical protein